MNNRYGIDVLYFKKELEALSESLPDRTKEELYNYLTALANIVKPPTSHNKDCAVPSPTETTPKSCGNCGRLPIIGRDYCSVCDDEEKNNWIPLDKLQNE